MYSNDNSKIRWEVSQHYFLDKQGYFKIYGKSIWGWNKYRVDKKEPFLLGYESSSETAFNSMLIDDAEIVNYMIAEFKKGNDLVYKAFSSKKFNHSGNYKISLKGFTHAYNKAMMCN